MIPEHLNKRLKESGNVLFLILIAVALFAALSYAVTQSTRGGGGSQGEVELISSAQVTQYPAGVRTAIVRMVIAGTGAEDLLFDSPSDFGNFGGDPVVEQRAVFHPRGGGATYTEPPGDLVIGSAAGDGLWHFNSNFEISNIGISGTGGTELIAFLPGISLGVCRRVNKELGIGGAAGTPPDAAGAGASNLTLANIKEIIMFGASSVSGYTQASFADTPVGTFPDALSGQPFGCFQVTGTPDNNVYYHVLLER